MKFSLPKQLAAAFACGALLVSASVSRADDQVATSRHHTARSTRIALPSEDSAVNSRTVDMTAPKNPASGGRNGKETRAITGTAIPKTYHRYGHITDTAQPVYVIDRDDPRFSSEGTVAGALRKLPFMGVGR